MSDILTLVQIKELLGDRVLSTVQEKTGLSWGTLDALRKGTVKKYNIGTIKTISEYLIFKG